MDEIFAVVGSVELTCGMDESLEFRGEELWKGELGVERCAFYLGDYLYDLGFGDGLLCKESKNWILGWRREIE
jgi:hypothetical protein